jgi:hypothetical protein
LELFGEFDDEMLMTALRRCDFAVEVVNLMGIYLRRINEFDTLFLEIEGLLFREIHLGGNFTFQLV